MEGKVVTIQGFKAIGLTYFGTNQKGEIPKLWETFNNRYKVIPNISHSRLCYGICDDMPDAEGKFSYTACAEVDSFLDVPLGMETRTVPGGKYLVYTYSGDLKDLNEFYENIFSKWLLASGQEMDMRPQLELYDERFMHNGEFDIYVPIK